MTSSTGSSFSAYWCGHGDLDLVANARNEIELHVDLVLLGPGIDELFHGIVAGRDPVVPQGQAQLAGRAGGADVHQRQGSGGRTQLERRTA